ncbi:MAG TPA: hypothetical protein VN808_00460 [Stellaceae bacterium]|nr:hypothetical protein [Stellaceae bacterium]
MIRAVVLALLVALAAAPAVAADQAFDLGAKAPVTDGKTWREVLRVLFPDLRQEPGKDGKIGDYIHGNVDLRPIDKEAFGGDCAEDPLRIEYIDYARVEIAGQMRVIVGVTTDGDACFGALALFDGTGDRLIDVANIQQDANYGFGPNFVRSLGADGQLVVADSFHTTTSNSPDNDVLVLATADKLALIGNVNAQSERDCRHTVAEDGYVLIEPDYGSFDRITGYIKRTVRRLAPDCETTQGTPSVTITRTDWRWDAGKKAYRKVSP